MKNKAPTPQNEADDALADAQRKKERICPECGDGFIPNRPQQAFCSPAHAKAFQKRQANRGRAIIALAMAWRSSRNAKGKSEEALRRKKIGSDAMTELSALLDSFAAEDRKEGRPLPFDYAELLMESGRFIDRRRS